MIESIYGVEMATSPVIVIECKLPIDSTTYQGAVKDLFPLKPGQTFRLGGLINDNDDPARTSRTSSSDGTTYGNFNPIDDMATAVLE